MREIYFDNAATTRVHPEVVDYMNEIMLKDYGNPSSKHIVGMNAEKHFRLARERVANALRVKPKEIIFTSGGTESNNQALIGAALQKRGKGRHIITSSIEHAAVYKPLEFLEGFDYEITVLPVDSRGHINIEDLASAIREDTVLVSIMYVNNEIGALEDISAIGKCIKEKNPNTLFHTDAIQAYGKYEIRPKKAGIDLLSVSAHKFHGPKGVGFLYIDEKVHIKPLLYGGGQQEDMRSGTHNVPGIAGLGLASDMAYENLTEKRRKLEGIKDYFIESLDSIEGALIHSEKGDMGAPHILSVSFQGVKAEVLLHALEEKGIYVSSGSACSSNHPGISGILKAIGLDKSLLDSTLRFSFSILNEKEEVDLCIEALKEIVPMLKRFFRH